MTPLHAAAQYRRGEIIDLFLAQPACDVNALDSDDQTPLHKAAMAGAPPEIVSCLLKHGTAYVLFRRTEASLI